MNKQDINIVWFKRDLRFTDHEPLHSAQRENIPLLLIYFFEPSLIAYDDSDVRHWRFVHESLQEMQEKLKSINTQIYIFHNEAQTVFTKLKENYNIKTYSEYNEGVLVAYNEYNERGQIVFDSVIGEYSKKIEYDKKHRLARWSSIDSAKNKSWKTFSYSKGNMIILHRREGNPAVIHKMVFGPKENGERVMISEKFL